MENSLSYSSRCTSTRRKWLPALTVANILCLGSAAFGGSTYTPITPTQAARIVTLTGKDLTIDEIVAVARDGAHVALSAAAQRLEADNYGLLLEAAAEGIPVYWFNRGSGDQRETVMFDGDPTSPRNQASIEATQSARFQSGALWGTEPEVSDEEIVRAMLVVRANAMVHDAPSPQLAQMLMELINRRITPVVESRGTLGEGDLAQLGNVGAAMVGAGEVYYQGTRMPAERALKLAGLKPIKPFGADDNALTSSNAYATGQAALLVHDAEQVLDWADIVYAIDLNGMNSSITPLSRIVQQARPEVWLNWHAARMLAMLKGSYLFDDDVHRIIQDPESLRASSIRQASAWEAWSALREAVLQQANSSDHNPAVQVGASPADSWELATPQMMRFYVKGGAHSHGEHGYIVSNANWDPYPLANKVESFDIAMGNMDIAVMLRIERFRNPFFTLALAADVIPAVRGGFYGYAPVDLQQEVQSLMNPIAPFGSAIVATVEDLQAQTRLKLQHSRALVATTLDLLSFDLLEGSLWLDVRKTQDGARRFGTVPTLAWQAFRGVVPLELMGAAKGPKSAATLAADFMRATPATSFFAGLPPQDVTVP